MSKDNAAFQHAFIVAQQSPGQVCGTSGARSDREANRLVNLLLITPGFINLPISQGHYHIYSTKQVITKANPPEVDWPRLWV